MIGKVASAPLNVAFPFHMIFDAVDRNPNNLDTTGVPFVLEGCNSAEFSGANRGKIFWVAEQDCPAIANKIVEAKCPLIGCHIQIGNSVVDPECHGVDPWFEFEKDGLASSANRL